MTYQIGELTEQAPRVPSGLIRRLRNLAREHRARPVSWVAAQRIAARQGALVAREAAIRNITVDVLVASLPQVRVETDRDLPASGLAVWNRDERTWIIRLNAKDAPERQRFTLLHEFKHILDHNTSVHLYDPRYLSGHAQAEMAADGFASAALMPARVVRRLVKRDRCDVVELARRLRVSRDRAALRLSDLNLQATTTTRGGNPS